MVKLIHVSFYRYFPDKKLIINEQVGQVLYNGVVHLSAALLG